MDKDAIVAWLKVEFQPLTLATPDETLEQIVDNSVRYWNTHSGLKLTTMFDPPAGGSAIQLNNQFKTVVNVYPSATTTWIWNDHPLWTLLGITILDNVTGDMIMMSEAFRNYRCYVGTDMRWYFEQSKVSSEGGLLFMTNLPRGTDKIAVVGTKRITADESITNEYIIDWILPYAKALLKQIEGNTLRKGGIVDIKDDGAELVREGKEEQKTFRNSLRLTAVGLHWFEGVDNIV